MKRLTAYILCLAWVFALSARTLSGIEVLKNNDFDILKGKKIGLLTNPTGVDSDLNSTIDILHSAPGVDLVTLFAPEHGIRGDVPAGATVTTSTDTKTGLKVYSLYGATKKPTAQMLKGLDAVVYDIQDIGSRSYTFISSLGKLMEACGENDVELIVLDRPNPLGGNRVEGRAKVDSDCRSFVSEFDIPYVYGLTPGELALWLNRDGKCRLSVVEMQGWNRNMLFGETGLPWVPTSPNIPTAETALYYPATGILGELGTVSIGANFTQPFKVVTSETLNADRLADELNNLKLKGVRFRPYHATVAGKQIHGVEIYITDPKNAEITPIQFHIMERIPGVMTNAKPARINMFSKVTGSKRFAADFHKRGKADDILVHWNDGVEEWKEDVARFLLYK